MRNTYFLRYDHAVLWTWSTAVVLLSTAGVSSNYRLRCAVLYDFNRVSLCVLSSYIQEYYEGVREVLALICRLLKAAKSERYC